MPESAKTHLAPRVTDWQAVAMFFAGVLVEEHPDWAEPILLVIEDNTREVKRHECA